MSSSINLAQARTYFSFGPTLIIGPNITKGDAYYERLGASLSRQLKKEAGNSFRSLVDLIIERDNKEVDVIKCIQDTEREMPSLTISPQMLNVNWSCIFSFATDNVFENQYRAHLNQSGSGLSLCVMDDLAAALPPRSIPCYKMLGSTIRDDFVTGTIQYISRRIKWRSMIRSALDLVREGSMLIMGMKDSRDELTDFVAELTADIRYSPTTLFFLRDDPLGTDRRLAKVNRDTEPHVIDATESEFLNEVERTQGADDFDIEKLQKHKKKLRELVAFQDIVSFVNSSLTPELSIHERNSLYNRLFSPSATKWDPFHYSLDFPRTVTPAIMAKIQASSIRAQGNEVVLITGNVSSGKTTVLRRVAFDTAATGNMSLYIRRIRLPDPTAHLLELFRLLKVIISEFGQRAFVFLDDPLAQRNIRPDDILNAARVSGLPITLVVTCRSTDYKTYESEHVYGHFALIARFELDDTLDEKEKSQLPDYLVKLGIYKSTEVAQSLISANKHLSTYDTLSVLFWLLPDTQRHITNSIKDEYFRLGDSTGLARVIIGHVKQSAALLQSAYRAVSVAEAFRSPIPIEVLVSYLKVDYQHWLDAIPPNSTAWGILYSEDSYDGRSVCYRTRNEIVTRSIIEVVNGGSYGHTGEVAAMKELLGACDSTTDVYRDFIISVLVPYDSPKLGRLEYAEGLSLYEAAIQAFPRPDRTLLHHKALWVKNKGNDPAQACDLLHQALSTRPSPYARKRELDEHIYTSLAAATLDRIDNGSLPFESGRDQVMDHLAKAKSSLVFNPRAVHVHASLITRLSDKYTDKKSPDVFHLINAAITEIDRTVFILSKKIGVGQSGAHQNVMMLESAKDKIVEKISTLESLSVEAENAWKKFGRQDGFVLAARKMMHTAKKSNTGTDYNKAHNYCVKIREMIRLDGGELSSRLCEIMLSIYYDWRVRRGSESPSSEVIDWDYLIEMAKITLGSTEFADDIVIRYIYAVCLAHKGMWIEAKNIFQELRRADLPGDLVYEPRDDLLHPNGGRREIQGIMRNTEKDKFVYCEELKVDFLAERQTGWPGEGQITHAKVYFCLAGPKAALW